MFNKVFMPLLITLLAVLVLIWVKEIFDAGMRAKKQEIHDTYSLQLCPNSGYTQKDIDTINESFKRRGIPELDCKYTVERNKE